MPGINIYPTENAVECLKKKLWYVVNSEDIKNSELKYNIINEDYYLNENDIIKFGNLIYIVKKINISNNDDSKENDDSNKIGQNSIKSDRNYNIEEINRKAEPIFNFYPSLEFEECKFYDGKKVKLCQCDKFIEINCLKKLFNDCIQRGRNGNVANFKLSNKFCEKCETIFPLSFKLKEKEEKEDLINILKLSEETKKMKKISNEKEIGNTESKDFNYMILESLCHEEDELIKKFHVINLSGINVINIGRKPEKDKSYVYDLDLSLSKDHALIKRKNGKLLIKNTKATYGTLVLIKNSLLINEKKINLQVGYILIEACLMKKKDFILIQNDSKKYPLKKKEDYYKEKGLTFMIKAINKILKKILKKINLLRD